MVPGDGVSMKRGRPALLSRCVPRVCLLTRVFCRSVPYGVCRGWTRASPPSGLPVFYGDVFRPEVLNAFNVGRAKAVICTLSDVKGTNKAVVNLRRAFPELPVSACWALGSAAWKSGRDVTRMWST